VETLQALLANLKAQFIPPVLVKGLPRAQDYVALDALAESFRKSSVAQPEQQTPIQKPAPQRYMCPVCRYVYDPALGDPAGGIPRGTPFEKIPDNWICPVCRVAKSMLRPIQTAAAAAESI